MKKVFFIITITLLLVFCKCKTNACYTDPEKVLEYMNMIRAEFDLPALTMDDTLKTAASVRAVELSQSFSHTRPDGSAWYAVADGLRGENLARAINDEQSKSLNIAYAWYLSPGHCSNLLKGTYTQVGISYYEKDGITYIACEFK